MPESVQQAKQSLRRQAHRFLTTDLYGRREVGEFCRELSDIGKVAIFGGMLRDLLLEGTQKFRSDIDLVIDTENTSLLQTVLARHSPQRTALGGYRIALRKWTVDVWPLKCTWAIRCGYVQGETLSDLIRTTFFNWDAVVYELRSGALHCSPHYIEELKSRLLSINLAPNPNPEGVAIRGLRLAVAKQARLSFVLAEYISDVLESVNIDVLLANEKRKHRPARVSAEMIHTFREKFKSQKAAGSTEPIILAAEQEELDLSLAEPQSEDSAHLDFRRMVSRSS